MVDDPDPRPADPPQSCENTAPRGSPDGHATSGDLGRPHSVAADPPGQWFARAIQRYYGDERDRFVAEHVKSAVKLFLWQPEDSLSEVRFQILVRRTYPIRFLALKMRSLLAYIFVISIIGYIIVFPYLMSDGLDYSDNLLVLMSAVAAWSICVVLPPIVMAPGDIQINLPRVVQKSFFFLTVILVCIEGGVLYYSAVFPNGTAVQALIGVWGYSGLITATFLASAGILAFSQLRSEARFPDAHLAILFVRIATMANAGGHAWADDVAFRSQMVENFDRAAKIVQFDLFSSFTKARGPSSLWRQRQAQSIAAALAEKQTWIMAPIASTREDILAFCRNAAIALLSGNWGNLPTADIVGDNSDHASMLSKLWTATLSYARNLLLAAAPALLFLTARRMDWITGLSPDILSYIQVAVFAWAVVSLLLMLDPQAKEKIVALKDAATLLSPSRKSKE
jgi:hypothetical protein